MNYPLRLPDQLKAHLRALRKSQGLTQAQLGALVGVKQARIAEIEANPGAVSLEQLTKVLAALSAALHLHAVETKAAVPGASSPRGAKPPPPPANKQRTAPKPAAPRAGVVIRAKKGTW